MNIPPRIQGSLISSLSTVRPGVSAGGSFASKLGQAAGGIVGTAVSVGKAVVQAAVPGGGVLTKLAGNLAGGSSEDLDFVDKVRTFAMTNAIFDAGSAPTVERDNS